MKKLNHIHIGIFIALAIFIALRLMRFNGLYGQDAYEYFRYARDIPGALQGQTIRDMVWPVVYSFSGAIVDIPLRNLPLSLSIVSFLALAGTALVMQKMLTSLYTEKTEHIDKFLMSCFVLSPMVMISSQVVMADMLGTFFTVAAFWLMIRYWNNDGKFSLPFAAAMTILAISTRYNAGVVLFPGVFWSAIVFFKRKPDLKALAVTVLAIALAALPQILIKYHTESLGYSTWLEQFTPVNLFRRSFLQSDGLLEFPFINLVYGTYPFVHPAFLFIGAPLLLFFKKQYFKDRNVVIIAVTTGIYIFFIMCLPRQNNRFMVNIFPLSLVLIYPLFHAVLEKISEKKVLIHFATVFISIVNIGLFTYAFPRYFNQNKIENEVIETVRKLPEYKRIYAFSFVAPIEAWDLPIEITGLFGEEINEFQTGSLVLFNEKMYAEQLKEKVTGRNWSRLQKNYRLEPLKEFEGGATLYRISEKIPER